MDITGDVIAQQSDWIVFAFHAYPGLHKNNNIYLVRRPRGGLAVMPPPLLKLGLLPFLSSLGSSIVQLMRSH
jgi:hypothetical protein